jgi:hypothetical protein
MSDAERLKAWSQPDESGCVLWTGHISPYGYGILSVRWRDERAHRLAWKIANGPIPDGMFVLHRCDVRNCVNPDHLFLGTLADNNRDKALKGRSFHPKGELHGRSKLTAEKVIAIRADTRPNITIADDYGVCNSIIGRVKKRKIWRHV